MSESVYPHPPLIRGGTSLTLMRSDILQHWEMALKVLQIKANFLAFPVSILSYSLLRMLPTQRLDLCIFTNAQLNVPGCLYFSGYVSSGLQPCPNNFQSKVFLRMIKEERSNTVVCVIEEGGCCIWSWLGSAVGSWGRKAQRPHHPPRT